LKALEYGVWSGNRGYLIEDCIAIGTWGADVDLLIINRFMASRTTLRQPTLHGWDKNVQSLGDIREEYGNCCRSSMGTKMRFCAG